MKPLVTISSNPDKTITDMKAISNTEFYGYSYQEILTGLYLIKIYVSEIPKRNKK